MFEKFIWLNIKNLEGKSLTFSQQGRDSDSHIFFDVKGDDNANATEAKIRLFNLQESTIKNITCGSSVTLAAGYVPTSEMKVTLIEDMIENYRAHDAMAKTFADLSYGVIFTGYVNTKQVEIKRPDLEVKLQCLSQIKSLLSEEVDQNLTWSTPVTAKAAISQLILRSGAGLGQLPESDGLTYDHLEFSGTTGETYYQAIKQICDENHWKFVETGSVVNVIEEEDGYIEELGYVLNNRSGLISVTPSEETYSEKVDLRTSYKVKCFLYYGLAVRHLVKIEHPILNATCMIDTVRFVSDKYRHHAEMSVSPVTSRTAVKFYPLSQIHPLGEGVNIFSLYEE